MKHLHFVGIGGARLSGLAKLYQDRGYRISGSDLMASRSTKGLEDKGIPVFYGHKPQNIDGADLVVYTNAVGAENPEVLEAKRRGVALIEGAELLGDLMTEVGYGIAIAGTHGKTTTTAMTSLILTEAGLDPTVLVGGELAALGGNHRSGKSKYMVVEACEFKRSFLNLKPNLELITNIDWDHPDCFPNLEEVVRTFKEFIALLPSDGTLCYWGDDPNAARLKEHFSGKTISFGYQADYDWSVTELIPRDPLGIAAQLLYKGRPQGQLSLRVPGRHNLQNALGSIAIATELGVPVTTALAKVATFPGVHRRFEIKGDFNGAMVVDDYAHHPGAIKTTLAAVRQFFKGKVWCVFQPHLYSRTKHLLPEFAQAFNDADILILADIYAAREVDTGEISSATLAKLTAEYHPDVRYLATFDRIEEHLQKNLRPGDLLITMGAGDIWKIGEMILKSQAAV